MGSCQIGFYFKPKRGFDCSEVHWDPLEVTVTAEVTGSGESWQLQTAQAGTLLSDPRAEQQLPSLSQEAVQMRVQIICSAPLFVLKHCDISPQR